MTTDEALYTLESVITDNQDIFENADRLVTANDLLDWLNVSEPSMDDLAFLMNAALSKTLVAWNCAVCGERCFNYGGDDHPGTHHPNEQDYVSYPPDYQHDRRCNHCRMWRRRNS